MRRAKRSNMNSKTGASRVQRVFQRFTAAQRWEHLLLLLSFSTLFLTGMPQKYRATAWSQTILSTPDRLELIRQIHHIAALVLTAEIIYHLCRAIYLMARKRLSSDMLPQIEDFKDAFKMLKYLFFLSKEKPAFGKYNFEQKITYWFLFFAIGIMAVSGYIIWFPEQLTLVFPGGVVPAAKLAHSTEAIIAGLFILIWHFFHVHIQRLNLSIFTGVLDEEEMETYHKREHQRLMTHSSSRTFKGDKK